MTKREHDAATKENWKCRGMASDERREYKARRFAGAGRDYVAERASEIRRTRRMLGRVDTLGVGSRFRASSAWRASQGLSLLRLG
jgi:hypothetical protein